MVDAPIAAWLPGPLPDDVARAVHRIAAAEDVVRVAVMPDVHLAEEVCIGCVVATRHLVYPAAVGGDIGCGVAALRFDGDAERLRDRDAMAEVLAQLYARVPALQHPSTRATPLDDALLREPLSDERLERLKAREGRTQLATLGRGNHFLELQCDDSGEAWLMVHSGSRAMGQAIRDHHVARAGGAGLTALAVEDDAGRAYLHDLAWALAYAETSRRRMAEVVAAIVAEAGLVADWSSFVSCHHNHVRNETHDAQALWVHRKGAIPAALDEPGLIPGSMGTPSYHTRGLGCAAALGSSSHGAGRARSRSDARRTIGASDVVRQMDGVLFDRRRADALRDEAPAAYKDIRAVMRAQHELCRIVRTLQPRLSYKG